MSDWQKYQGKYDKKFYDVRMPNGVVYTGLWPNAGLRSSGHSRFLGDKDDFEIRPSQLDDLGLPQRAGEAATEGGE